MELFLHTLGYRKRRGLQDSESLRFFAPMHSQGAVDGRVSVCYTYEK